MRTICVKTNDLNKIDYLLKEFDNISLKDIYLSSYKFKIFQVTHLFHLKYFYFQTYVLQFRLFLQK